ncbi:MAG TPA: alkaline phosphatase family protein [Streptosporangiaceae bacterium]|jgi:hypothetical protein|nr:alkaline phosphatase family protein [Streptosporangiaceae bacterium]
MRTRLGFGLVVAAVLAAPAATVGPSAGASVATTGGTRVAARAATAENVPSFGHVFLIIGENTTYSHLTSANAPFLMNKVRPRAAWLTNYYAATHWSQANYVAMVSGQFNRCEQKDGGIACHQNVDNLYHQLDQAKLSWKVWLEAGKARCDTSSGGSCISNKPCPLSGFYTTGNPPILFDNIEGPGGVWSATKRSRECLANDVPAGTKDHGMVRFNNALATGHVARFNTVIPHGCDDGEANCKPVNKRFTQFDNFLAHEVPKIEASPAFGRDGVIIITYDEDQRAGGIAAKNGLGSGGHVVCAIISRMAVPGSYGRKYYHYSVLRTLEDGFRLGSYLGDANAVKPVNNIWR